METTRPGSIPTHRAPFELAITLPRLTARFRAHLQPRVLLRWYLPTLLLIFLVKGVVIGTVHPAFTGHDEVAHYAYLEILSTEHRVPAMPDPDVLQSDPDAAFDKLPASLWAYCHFTTEDWGGCAENTCPETCYARVDPETGATRPAGWVYTANHPPLYYLLMAPLYELTDHLAPEEQLTWLRFAAIPFGMIVVLCAWLTTRTLFPRDRFLQITVPAVVAFQPQIAYEAAMLNNDIMAIALVSIVIWLCARGVRTRFPLANVLLIGATFGLALLTKTTALPVGIAIAATMILGLGWRNVRVWLPRGLLAGSVTLLLVWPWYWHMLRTYGDLNGLSRIRELQWWNYDNATPPSLLNELTNRDFFWTIWGQTWGGFGWLLMPAPESLLRKIFLVASLAMIGLAVRAIRAYLATSCSIRDGAPRLRMRFGVPLNRRQGMFLLALGVFVAGSYGAILQFGTQFEGTQARYAFPAVTAVALLAMVGIRSLVPSRALPVIAVLTMAGMVWLNVEIYRDAVMPWIDAQP